MKKKIKNAIKIAENSSLDDVYLEDMHHYKNECKEDFKKNNKIGLSMSLTNLARVAANRFIISSIRNDFKSENLIKEAAYLSHKSIMLSTSLSVYEDDRSEILTSLLSKFFAIQILCEEKAKIDESFKCISYKLNNGNIFILNEYRALYFLYSLYEKYSTGTYNKKLITVFPEMSDIYNYAIDNFDSTDNELIESIVKELANEHLEQSHFDGEYQYEDLWIYPYEILAFLSLRKMAGFQYPKTIDHPIFDLPWVKLPEIHQNFEYKDDFIDTAYTKIIKQIEREQS